MLIEERVCHHHHYYHYVLKEFTGYLRAVEDYFRACCNSSVSNFFTWIRFLPGDMFDIKKKASTYWYVQR